MMFELSMTTDTCGSYEEFVETVISPCYLSRDVKIRFDLFSNYLSVDCLLRAALSILAILVS